MCQGCGPWTFRSLAHESYVFKICFISILYVPLHMIMEYCCAHSSLLGYYTGILCQNQAYVAPRILSDRELCLFVGGRCSSTRYSNLSTLCKICWPSPDHCTPRNFTEVTVPWILLRFIFHYMIYIYILPMYRVVATSCSAGPIDRLTI